MVEAMRAVRTSYAVAGWGEGELWTLDDVVLSHELAFEPVSDTVGVEARNALHGLEPESRFPTKASVYRESALRGETIGTLPAHIPLDRSRCLTPSLPSVLVARFTAFLQGEDVSLTDVPIDLTWCTPFQHAVAVTLRAVPRGEVVSYGELAALAGNPGAARAVGTFCARNRFMLIVPCHRVVAAAGIGGYGSAGAGVKSRLLALEGVRL